MDAESGNEERAPDDRADPLWERFERSGSFLPVCLGIPVLFFLVRIFLIGRLSTYSAPKLNHSVVLLMLFFVLLIPATWSVLRDKTATPVATSALLVCNAFLFFPALYLLGEMLWRLVSLMMRSLYQCVRFLRGNSTILLDLPVIFYVLAYLTTLIAFFISLGCVIQWSALRRRFVSERHHLRHWYFSLLGLCALLSLLAYAAHAHPLWWWTFKTSFFRYYEH